MDDLKKPQLIAHIEKSLDYSIFDTRWIPCSAKFVVLGSKPNSKGALKIYELTDTNEMEMVKSVEGESSYRCGTFGASSLRSAHFGVGDFQGNFKILDIERSAIPIYNIEKAHNGIINAIDAVAGASLNCGAPEIVTGGRDGRVQVWDPRHNGGPVCCIQAKDYDATSGNGGRDCWAVAFGNSYNNSERIVCSGYDNGDVKLFDLRTCSVRWETNVKNGVCGIEFDRKDIEMNKMVVTTLEGGLHVYDMRTQHPEKGFSMVSERDAGRSLGTRGIIEGQKATLWCVKHLPQNRDLFVTCGGAGSIRLWNYEYPTNRVKELSDGHNVGVTGELKMLQAAALSTQPVNCFDWCQDHMGLAVCGALDQTIRVLISTKLNLY